VWGAELQYVAHTFSSTLTGRTAERSVGATQGFSFIMSL
jgi:hypothetical protein